MEDTTKPSVAQTEEESTDLDTVEDVVESEESTESEVDWKAEAEKQKQLAENQKVRAEKAERQAKTKVETKVETQPGLSSKDTIALINAKVHEDDVDEVVDYAKFKKISIPEALKSSVIKTSLSERQELRNTANATNPGRTRSGSSKVSGDALLEKARKTGEVPESDADLDAMLTSRYKKK